VSRAHRRPRRLSLDELMNRVAAGVLVALLAAGVTLLAVADEAHAVRFAERCALRNGVVEDLLVTVVTSTRTTHHMGTYCLRPSDGMILDER